jgi:hypothetical protein
MCELSRQWDRILEMSKPNSRYFVQGYYNFGVHGEPSYIEPFNIQFNSLGIAPPTPSQHASPRAPISVKTPTRRFAPKAIDPPPALTPSASDVQGSLPGPSMSPSLLRKGKQPSTSAPFTSFSRAGPSNQPKRARSPVESIDISLDLSSSQTAHSTTGWSSITGASGDSSASKDIEDVLQDDDGGDYITSGPIRPPSSKRRRAKTAKA